MNRTGSLFENHTLKQKPEPIYALLHKMVNGTKI